jgi:TRAP-type C4-dicarboxylate transport system permease large subunit
MKRSLFSRILALLAVALILGLFGGVIYCIVTGSEHLMAMMFTAIVVPLIIYLLVWLKKVFSRTDDSIDYTIDKESTEDGEKE